MIHLEKDKNLTFYCGFRPQFGESYKCTCIISRVTCPLCKKAISKAVKFGRIGGNGNSRKIHAIVDVKRFGGKIRPTTLCNQVICRNDKIYEHPKGYFRLDQLCKLCSNRLEKMGGE